jgi:ribonuclease P protein component
MQTNRYTFPKNEKLKSKIAIGQLFTEGLSVKKYPIKLIFLPKENSTETPTQAAFAVPKRSFKLAVKRNRIKRLMREAYRHQKPELFNKLTTSYNLLFLYLGKEELPYETVFKKMKVALKQFTDTLEIKNEVS